MSLAKEILKERSEQEKSLRDVARATGLSRMAVFNVEREKSTLETAIRVAKSLGIRGKRLMTIVQHDVAKLVRTTA